MTGVRQRTEGEGKEPEHTHPATEHSHDHAKEAHVHDHTAPTESPAYQQAPRLGDGRSVITGQFELAKGQGNGGTRG